MSSLAATRSALLGTGLLLVLGATPARAQAPFPPPAYAYVEVFGTGESFAVRVEDPAVLDEMWDIAYNLAFPRIVVGTIRTGNGGYNLDAFSGTPWSWHLDEDTIELVDATIELCDGRPSFVEADILGYDGGTFCPWGSRVLAVEPVFGYPADTNVDGQVDQADADRIAQCLTAPGQQCVDIQPACCQGDVDSDTDVDCADFAAVAIQWTGDGDPIAPAACVAAQVPTASTPWLALALAGAGVAAWASSRRKRADPDGAR